MIGITFRVAQFKKFHELLMENAPLDYKPWYFPCKINGKDPDPEAIKRLDRNSYGSWKHPSARLEPEEVIEHIQKGQNIALSARAEDCLVIGDIDNPEYFDQTPEYTLADTSRKRVGGHFFGLDKDGTAKINQPTSNGEMRSIDMYVLIPGSYVPLDLTNAKDKKFYDNLSEEAKTDPQLGYYTVATEFPLRELSLSDLPEFFKEAHEEEIVEQKKIEVKLQNKPKTNFKEKGKYSELLNLKVSDIVGNISSSIRFGHPLHESETDANFSIDSKGLGHCWRCDVTLNAVQFLCVKAGYKKCFEAGTPHKVKGKPIKYSRIKGDRQALEVAYQEALKMKLISEYVGEPKGLGRVLNIQKIAEQYHFTNCPKCSNAFEFNSRMGWFSCNICGSQGGIKKFLLLYNLNKLGASQ